MIPAARMSMCVYRVSGHRAARDTCVGPWVCGAECPRVDWLTDCNLSKLPARGTPTV